MPCPEGFPEILGHRPITDEEVVKKGDLWVEPEGHYHVVHGSIGYTMSEYYELYHNSGWVFTPDSNPPVKRKRPLNKYFSEPLPLP